MSPPVGVVLFDLGGVLVDVSGVRAMRSLTGITNAEELWQRWLACPWVRRFESGACSETAFADGLVAEWGLPVSPAVFLDGFRGHQRAALARPLRHLAPDGAVRSPVRVLRDGLAQARCRGLRTRGRGVGDAAGAGVVPRRQQRQRQQRRGRRPVYDVFVRDRVAGATSRVSVTTSGAQRDRGGFGPAISADGRYVAFTSLETNLVPGDTNRTYDVFRRDRGAVPAVPSATGAP